MYPTKDNNIFFSILMTT